MDLRGYLAVLRRRKWTVVFTMLIAVATAATQTYFTTPVFLATATVRVAQPVQRADLLGNRYDLDRLINTYVLVLESRPLLERLAELSGYDIAPARLAAMIQIDPVVDTELILIKVRDTWSERASILANSLSTLLVEESRGLFLGGREMQDAAAIDDLILAAEETLVEDQQALAAEEAKLRPSVVDIEALRARVEIDRQILTNLIIQAEQGKLLAAVGSESVSIVEPAFPPRDPIEPNQPRNLALGLLAGLAGGVALAFVFENLDPTIRSSERLERIAEVPVLAALPRARVPVEPQRWQVSEVKRYSAWPTGEAYRILRTSLEAMLGGSNPKILLCTSPGAKDGKSTVAANLALALAQGGHRVALLDCDLRKPRLHQIFRLANVRGLGDVLAGDDGEEPNTNDLWQVPMDGLDLLVSGGLPPNPTELLRSDRMLSLLMAAASKRNFVLLDGPPVLNFADAGVLAAEVDGVLLVVGRGRATEQGTRQALRRLERVKANVIGVVLNQADQVEVGYY